METFKTLSSISVKDKIERKGNLDYISWANAWSELKRNFPKAQRIVFERPDGLNYFTDGKTAWVKVGIDVDGLLHIDYLPIMDYRNNAIPLEKITATDVNKTIQRSTTKAIAMHGYGLSLWTGEDIVDIVPTTTPEQTKTKTKKGAPEPITSNPPLVKGSLEFSKVVNYITTNKDLGFDKITQQIQRKYSLSTEMIIELENIFKL